MCIICIKTQGTDLPNDSTIKQMFENNPNGAGFAYRRVQGGPVLIDKGYFDVKKLIINLKKKVKKEDAAIIHFRLATSGLVDAGNCHPFPVDATLEEMREVKGKTDCAIAHNGIFDVEGDVRYSDTMLWIISRLDSKIIKGLGRATVQHLINDSLGTSKLAVLSSREKLVLMFGHWEHDKKTNLYFSNTGYKNEVNQWVRWRKDWDAKDKKVREYYQEESGDTWRGNYGDFCGICGHWQREDELIYHEGLYLCTDCLLQVTNGKGLSNTNSDVSPC